jgi:Flp pilus assembly pilin Flp
MKGGSIMRALKRFFLEEDGMGTVEVILIIVVLVGLVIIFKDNITQIVEDLFDKITTKTSSV